MAKDITNDLSGQMARVLEPLRKAGNVVDDFNKSVTFAKSALQTLDQAKILSREYKREAELRGKGVGLLKGQIKQLGSSTREEAKYMKRSEKIRAREVKQLQWKLLWGKKLSQQEITLAGKKIKQLKLEQAEIKAARKEMKSFTTIIGSVKRKLGELADGKIGKAIGTMVGKLSALFGAIGVGASVKAILNDSDNAFKSIAKSVGTSVKGASGLTKNFVKAHGAMSRFGVSMEDSTAALNSLVNATGSVGFATEKNIVLVTQLNKAFGMSNEEGSKLIQTLTYGFGLTDKQTQSFASNLSKDAYMGGIAVGIVMKDIQQATENTAFALSKSPDKLKEMAIRSRQLGSNLSDIEKLGATFGDFESSIDNTRKMAAMFGTQINAFEMTRLSQLGEEEKIQDNIVKQLSGKLVDSQGNLTKMTRIQSEQLRGMLGDQYPKILKTQAKAEWLAKRTHKTEKERMALADLMVNDSSLSITQAEKLLSKRREEAELQKDLNALISGMMTAFEKISSWVKSKIIPVINSLNKEFWEGSSVIDGMLKHLDKMIPTTDEIVSAVKGIATAMKEAWNWAKPFFTGIGDFAKKHPWLTGLIGGTIAITADIGRAQLGTRAMPMYVQQAVKWYEKVITAIKWLGTAMIIQRGAKRFLGKDLAGGAGSMIGNIGGKFAGRGGRIGKYGKMAQNFAPGAGKAFSTMADKGMLRGLFAFAKKIPKIGKIVTILGAVAAGAAGTGIGTALGGAKGAGGILGDLAGGSAGAAIGAAIGTAILPGIGTAVGGMLGGAAGSYFGESVGEWFGENISPALNNIGIIVKSLGIIMWKEAKKYFNDLSEMAKPYFDKIRDVVNAVDFIIREKMQAVVDGTLVVVKKIADFLPPVTSMIRELITFVIRPVKELVSSFSSWWNSGNFLADTAKSLQERAAKSATGNVFNKPTLGMVGEEGRSEVVIPTERIRKGMPIKKSVANELASIGVPGYGTGWSSGGTDTTSKSQKMSSAGRVSAQASAQGLAMASGDLITSQDRVMTVMAANTEQSNKQGKLMLKLNDLEIEREEERNKKDGINWMKSLENIKNLKKVYDGFNQQQKDSLNVLFANQIAAAKELKDKFDNAVDNMKEKLEGSFAGSALKMGLAVSSAISEFMKGGKQGAAKQVNYMLDKKGPKSAEHPDGAPSNREKLQKSIDNMKPGGKQLGAQSAMAGGTAAVDTLAAGGSKKDAAMAGGMAAASTALSAAGPVGMVIAAFLPLIIKFLPKILKVFKKIPKLFVKWLKFIYIELPKKIVGVFVKYLKFIWITLPKKIIEVFAKYLKFIYIELPKKIIEVFAKYLKFIYIELPKKIVGVFVKYLKFMWITLPKKIVGVFVKYLKFIYIELPKKIIEVFVKYLKFMWITLPKKIISIFKNMASQIGRMFKKAVGKLNPTKWFSTGGVVTSPTMSMIGETGEKEMVVPIDRIKNGGQVDPAVMSELAGLGAYMKGGSTSSSSGGGNESLVAELRALRAEIAALAGRPIQLNIDGRKIALAVSEQFNQIASGY
jgi:hypothetical protein